MEFIETLLGLEMQPRDLNTLQVCARGVVVFLFSLIIVRLGHKRFLSKMTAFDVILGFILASMLSRAINGSAPLIPTLGCGLVLVLLHRLLSTLSFYSHRIGVVIKGSPDVLIEDGNIQKARLRKNRVTERDLLEESRLNGQVENLEQVRLATLERNGSISVIPFEKETPRGA